MEAAATQDLDGVTVLPLLLQEIGSRSEPAGVTAMLGQLRPWIAAGAHRKKNAPVTASTPPPPRSPSPTSWHDPR